MMIDGHKDSTVGERKLIWDEENRLLAVDENGFVSNYWYDADGECTVKTSGENEAIYVNSEFSGGNTGTAHTPRQSRGIVSFEVLLSFAF